MDTDVKVLAEIAKDKARVEELEGSIENGTLLSGCPFDGNDVETCETVCHKIWTDLKRGQCPCSKPHRLEIAQAIIALSKLLEEPRTYRIGDCFSYENGVALMVRAPDNSILLTNITNECKSYVTPLFRVKDILKVPGERLEDAFISFGGMKYIGHISELTIKNGKVVPS